MEREYEHEQNTAACSYTNYNGGSTSSGIPATGENAEGIERHVWEKLYKIEDPEMPISIVDLGLIYSISITDSVAHIDMTLTYSGCPARDMITGNVKSTVENLRNIEKAEVNLIYAPPWNVNMVTESGREQLREFGLSV